MVRGIRPVPPDSLPGWTQVLQSTASVDIGVQTRFQRADGLELDTYVYPVATPDAACLLDCLHPWIKQEADGFRDDGPPQFIQAGYFSDLTLTADDELPAPLPGFTPIRHLAFDATDTDGSRGRSDYLLTARQGYRVKLRLTDYAGLADSGTAVAAFHDLLAGIEWPYDCLVAPSPDVTSISMESTLDIRPRELVDVIDSVLADEGIELKSRSGYWVGVPTFTWPGGSTDEGWHGEYSPGYQIAVRIQERGDSTAMGVWAPTVCDIGALGEVDGTSVRTVLQALATGQLSLKISEAVEASNR